MIFHKSHKTKALTTPGKYYSKSLLQKLLRRIVG